MERLGMNQHQLNQDELLRISRAISDTTRYALLEKIYLDQRITVGELCAESTVSAGTVAHHIKILKEAGLIQISRQGRYRLLLAQGVSRLRRESRQGRPCVSHGPLIFCM